MPDEKMVTENRRSGVASEPALHVANRGYTGAVTIAKAGNVCGNPLMTASNPGANAAAAMVPAFVTIKYGK